MAIRLWVLMAVLMALATPIEAKQDKNPKTDAAKVSQILQEAHTVQMPGPDGEVWIAYSRGGTVLGRALESPDGKKLIITDSLGRFIAEITR